MATGTSQNTNHNEFDADDMYEHGDFNVNEPNPVNPHPKDSADYPKPKPTTTKIEEMPPPQQITAQSPAINHPPRPPGPALGPYYQFLKTDLNKMLWIGSALVFRQVSFERPKIEFSSKPKLDYSWEVLYDNLCDMKIYRINISIELRNGEGDDEIGWKVNWGDHTTDGLFHIARYNQKWRGGFFSCNGFGCAVPPQEISRIKLGNVWEHLNSIHAQTPLHLLIWGGDQNYNDFVFKDVPYLKDWVNMEWNMKWTCDFRDDLRDQVEHYYFSTSIENWERPEVKSALESIPSIMMWDDHDIFDGAGSYPPLLHDSPMMSGLFKIAQKIRLLFQHHTTVEKARDHGLFGYQGYNYLIQCGPNLAILGADGRTERNTETVQHEKTWDMIFEKLENTIINIPHLIVVFAIPFSFVRFQLAASIFERMKNLPNKCRNLPLVRETNSIFDLPDPYDDLLDEWTHDAHIDERNRVLQRFQEMAEKKKVRVTFFSGDVHCCGISRFKTQNRNDIVPAHDDKLMYQVISSAIVNLPPSRTAIYVAHFVKTKWYPIENTEEELIDFFDYSPETGRRLWHKKLLPNRNWCYFEQSEEIHSSVYTPVKTGCFHCQFGSKKQISPVMELSPISRLDDHVNTQPPKHQDTNEKVGQTQTGINSLKVRIWVESGLKRNEERHFASYDLLIPHLV